MGENENGDSDIDSGIRTKRQTKVRDLFTDRIVGIISGAAIPLVLLFIPLVNKYLDNSKDIQTLQIQNNADDIENTNKRMSALSEVFVACQLQVQALTDKLTTSTKEFSRVNVGLVECQAQLKDPHK